MRLGFRTRAERAPRHPLYPDLAATPARGAKGECAALAGTFGELARAAAAGARPRLAVFALSYGDVPWLSDAQRDALWRWFEVPMFALWIGGGGRVVAYECEAQDGLHLETNAPPAAGTLETAPCACGRPGPRLVAASLLDTANAAD